METIIAIAEVIAEVIAPLQQELEETKMELTLREIENEIMKAEYMDGESHYKEIIDSLETRVECLHKEKNTLMGMYDDICKKCDRLQNKIDFLEYAIDTFK